MAPLSFLGAGNMAAAIIDGLIAKDPAARSRLACLGGAGGTAAALAARTGIRLARSLEDLIAPADVLVVAFKPQHLATADSALTELTQGKLVLSVLAGKTLGSLARVFPHARNIVRTMPNTPAAIGAGITPYCTAQPLSAADRSLVQQLLDACGQHLELPEEQMDAATAVSGCGPGFIFEFAAALRDAGIAAHLPPAISGQLTMATLLGAAKLLAQRQLDPEVLRNQVTSPKGATFAGLQRLEAGAFRELIRDTVAAAKVRAAELSRDS